MFIILNILALLFSYQSITTILENDLKQHQSKIYKYLRFRGKKITCPGARDKLNFRQDKHIFSPNVRRTSKKLNASILFLDKDKLFGNRTSKNFDALARGTSENF